MNRCRAWLSACCHQKKSGLSEASSSAGAEDALVHLESYPLNDLKFSRRLQALLHNTPMHKTLVVLIYRSVMNVHGHSELQDHGLPSGVWRNGDIGTHHR